MKRNRAVSLYATLYRGEGDTETELEVEVCGLIEPYVAGNYENPPEGGYAEDIQAIFHDGKKARSIQLTEWEEQDFNDQLVLADADYWADMDYEPDTDGCRDYD